MWHDILAKVVAVVVAGVVIYLLFIMIVNQIKKRGIFQERSKTLEKGAKLEADLDKEYRKERAQTDESWIGLPPDDKRH